MAKLTLTDISNFRNQTVTANTINSNNNATETALENTLSRDGTSPNQMNADLDMNSNDILNVGDIDASTGTIDTINTSTIYLDGVEVTTKSLGLKSVINSIGPVVVSSITALKALSTATYKAAFLNLGGQSGEFVFLSGDYAARVTADTAGAIYLKADDTATTSGAWVRVYDGLPQGAWFGADPSAGSNDTALTAMTSLSSIVGPIALAAGVFTTTLATAAIPPLLAGPGQVDDSAARHAPIFINQTAAPSAGNPATILTAFDGDLSRVAFAVEKRITGSNTLGAPGAGAYTQLPETSMFYGYAYNSSGKNFDVSSGRTGSSMIDLRFAHAGQGDYGGIHVGGIVTGTHPGGATQFSGAAGIVINGDVYAGTDHAYLNIVEFNADDLGHDVAAIGFVFNATRTVSTAALQDVWFGSRFQSKGSAAADVAYSMTGKWNVGIDFTDATLTNGAAVAMKSGQRLYLNGSSSGFIGWAQSLGTVWIDYASSALRLVVGSSAILSASSSAVTLTQPLVLPSDPASALQAATKQYVDNGFQPKDATLTALAAYNTNGLLTQTAADTFTGRTLPGTSNEIPVTNGNGVSGNPTVSLPSALTFTGKTVTGGTFNVDALSVTSSTNFQPQVMVYNTTNDANAGYFMVSKGRAGAAVQVGDTLGTFIFRGLDSTGTPVMRNGAALSALVESVSAGAVAAKFQMISGSSILEFRSDGKLYLPSASTILINSTQVIGARDTGWTAMTGSSNKATSYDTSTVTLAQLAGRVMALQASLTTHGLIGA